MLNILVFGYGVEGQSTAKFFTDRGDNVTIFDQQSHPQEPDWEKADLVFLSPGIPPDKVPEVARKKTTNQLNWFLGECTADERKKIIGITGSKGKTTTTLATVAWLKTLGFNTNYAGNIGHGILDTYADFKAGNLDYLVLEVSSFQAEILKHSPEITLFLGLFADHLDRHGDLKNYGKAKSNLWRHQSSDGIVITTGFGEKTVKAFPSAGTTLTAETLTPEEVPTNHTLQAPHFRQNLGVLKPLTKILGKAFDVNLFHQALNNMEMPAHRLEFVTEKNGLKFYNDAIAVNPEAVIAAVKFFKSDLKVLILGGTDSGGTFTELCRTIQAEAPQVTIIMVDSPITPLFKTASDKINLSYTIVQDLESAVNKGLNLNTTGVCLLSPAGKSFDVYPNYGVKGDHFKTLVKKL